MFIDHEQGRCFESASLCCFPILVLSVEYDFDDNPIEDTMKAMVDGGTAGFKGHARVILPGLTPCLECTIWLFPRK